MKNILYTIILSLLFSSVCLADNSLERAKIYFAGLRAYEAGDYETAHRKFSLIDDYELAQFFIGRMYRYGEGVPQDTWEAMKWYELASNNGHPHAFLEIAAMFENGEGVLPIDYLSAVKWYRVGASMGNYVAFSNLGIAHGEGKGVLKDKVLAYMWYSLAAVGLSYHDKIIKILSMMMSPREIEEAQRLARECIKKDYKDCG